MRPFGAKAENVGGHLHDAVALRSAAGDDQTFDPDAVALLQPRRGLAQGVGDAFDDRPVHMRAGVHVAEADHRPLGLGAGNLDPGIPERLKDQPRNKSAHQSTTHVVGSSRPSSHHFSGTYF